MFTHEEGQSEREREWMDGRKQTKRTWMSEKKGKPAQVMWNDAPKDTVRKGG